MNAKPTRSANPVHRLLGVFEEHPEVDAIVVYSSLCGPVEARALDRRGRRVGVDPRSALGERAWRKLCDAAELGAPVVVARKDAQEKSSWIFGAKEAASHERDVLGQAAGPDFPGSSSLRSCRL